MYLHSACRTAVCITRMLQRSYIACRALGADNYFGWKKVTRIGEWRRRFSLHPPPPLRTTFPERRLSWSASPHATADPTFHISSPIAALHNVSIHRMIRYHPQRAPKSGIDMNIVKSRRSLCQSSEKFTVVYKTPFPPNLIPPAPNV